MRQFSHVVTVAALAVVLSGCGVSDVVDSASLTATPSVAPSVHPATPADIAAAQQAHLDYEAAGNALDLTKPSTLDDFLATTTSPQSGVDRAFYEELQAKGWTMSGRARVILSEIDPASSSADLIRLAVCNDIGDIRFFDETGAERIPPSDADISMTTVTVKRVSDDRWLVSDVEPRSGDPECSRE